MTPNTTTTTTAAAALAPDDVDDLIYACRTGDLDWLQELLNTHSQTLNLSAAEIISSAIDIDADGLGSRACLLHYPAANGNLETVTFLLDRLLPSTASPQPSASNGSTSNSNSMLRSTSTATALVNHQNVNGNTPLHWAALNGHLTIVQALVNAGADPTIVNEAGRDAVVEAEYSAKDSAADCAHWLLKECEALEKGAGGGQHGDENGDEQMVAEAEQQHEGGVQAEKVTNGEHEHEEGKDGT